jgi:hypothetical protein
MKLIFILLCCAGCGQQSEPEYVDRDFVHIKASSFYEVKPSDNRDDSKGINEGITLLVELSKMDPARDYSLQFEDSGVYEIYGGPPVMPNNSSLNGVTLKGRDTIFPVGYGKPLASKIK